MNPVTADEFPAVMARVNAKTNAERAQAQRTKTERDAEVRATFASALNAIGLTQDQRGTLAEWIREASTHHPDVQGCCGCEVASLAQLIQP